MSKKDEALKAWAATYAAFRGAFDSPIARRRDGSEYANDARERMRDFDECIREALAEPPKWQGVQFDSALHQQPAQQEPKKDLMWSTVAMQERHDQRIQKVVATLEQIKQEQLAEQPAQQEPLNRLDVACAIKTLCANGDLPDSFEDVADWIAAGSMPDQQPAQQEPVAWIHGDEYGDACHWVGGRMPPAGTNLYTAPPAQQEQKPPKWQGVRFDSALHQQPAQQEPVSVWEMFAAYLLDKCEGEIITEEFLQRALADMLTDPKYAAPQPAQQEPVAYIQPYDLEVLKTYSGQCQAVLYRKPAKTRIAIYTSPPASKPLTREQVKAIMAPDYNTATMQERADFMAGFRAAEAAHGIKEKNT